MKTTTLLCLGVLLMFCRTLAAQAPGPCLGLSRTAYVNWPQFHSDPCHTGYNASESILSPANVGNLVLDWKYDTGISVYVSSPAMANGVVYFGADDYKFYALNASSGIKLWSYTTGNTVYASPAVANG